MISSKFKGVDASSLVQHIIELNRDAIVDANCLSEVNKKAPKDSDKDSEKTLAEMGIVARNFKTEDAPRPLQTLKTDIGNLLIEMYRQYEYPTIRLCIGDFSSLECHLLVLQCYSDYFRKIDAKSFTNDECVVSLPIETVSVRAFCFIYDWMLSSENVKLTPTIIVEVYKAAEYLQIGELMHQCWVCFDDVAYYKEDKAFLLFLEAAKYNIDTVMDIMIKRITKYFLPMLATESFLQLPCDVVRVLLSSSTIGVNSEIEVFYAAAYWLIHNWQNDHQNTIELLKHVRFGLLPLGFFAILRQMPGNFKIKCITEQPETTKLLNSSIVLCKAQIICDTDEAVFKPMSSGNQRQWVFDQNCPYHQRAHCVKRRIESYAEFETYIEELKKADETYWTNMKLL